MDERRRRRRPRIVTAQSVNHWRYFSPDLTESEYPGASIRAVILESGQEVEVQICGCCVVRMAAGLMARFPEARAVLLDLMDLTRKPEMTFMERDDDDDDDDTGDPRRN